jgi:hypothetical protein
VEAVGTLRGIVAREESVVRAWVLYDSDEKCPATDFSIHRAETDTRVGVSLGLVRTIDRAKANVVIFLEDTPSSSGSDALAPRIRKIRLLCGDMSCRRVD